MRLIKMIGLAAIAAVAAMAFIGASTAGAVIHEGIGLCKVEELLLCATGNLIDPASGTLLGTATNPVLEGTINEKCETGMAKATVTSPADKTLLMGSISVLTFTGNCTPCSTVTVEGLPYTASLTHTLEPDVWTLAATGKAKLSNCTFGITCKFGGEVKSTVEMVGGQVILNTNKSVLTKEEGGIACGSSGKWNAKYVLKWTLTADGVEHNPFPTLLEKV